MCVVCLLVSMSFHLLVDIYLIALRPTPAFMLFFIKFVVLYVVYHSAGVIVELNVSLYLIIVYFIAHAFRYDDSIRVVYDPIDYAVILFPVKSFVIYLIAQLFLVELFGFPIVIVVICKQLLLSWYVYS